MQDLGKEGEKRIDWRVTGIGRLPCRVGNGFGPGEYGIIIEFETKEGDKKKISTIASEPDVFILEKPARGKTVKGELEVRVLSEERDCVRVLLPFDTMNSGYTVSIPKNILSGSPQSRFPREDSDPARY